MGSSRAPFTYGLLLALCLPLLAQAGKHDDVHNAVRCSENGFALGGYDAVSYHLNSGPLLGSPEILIEHGGNTYSFVSTENRRLFEQDPSKYAPSYLGWCSTALAHGRLLCPDYTNYKIENGRLLLFENVGFVNGRDLWNSNEDRYRRRANNNFKKFVERGRHAEDDA